MIDQLDINPVRALQFAKTLMEDNIRRSSVSRQQEVQQLTVQDNTPTPTDHGRHARLSSQNMRPMNFLDRFINLLA